MLIDRAGLSRLFCIAVLSASLLPAQLFRGEIKGSVLDATGAAIPEATVQAVNKATGVVRSTTTTQSGEFSLPDMALGKYDVTASKQGFQDQKSEVEVVVTRVTNVAFTLAVGSQAASVEVSAAVVAIDTSSTTLAGVVNTKTVADLPMNGRDFRQMLKLAPGVNPVGNSVNGNRTRGNNYQIDGADNNDGFQNTSAVNQGGVSGIAGTLLPVEAIDQFSVSTNGSAEMGRNGGGIVNLVIKSGTNQLHGSAYYFNRNEYFAENTPFAAEGSRVRRIRNNQGGFSLGGPIIKNRTFFFMTGEAQEAEAANGALVTTFSPAWLEVGRNVLRDFNIPENPVTRNLISFWPERVRTGPAVVNNYFSNDANIYDSYNGIVKVDHTLNSANNLSMRYYGGTGKQAAVVNTAAPFLEYFQVAPSRMHNVSVALNSVMSPRLVNSLVLGANYFLQTFNDFDTSPDPIAAGLNTGVTAESLRGSPTLNISGFATAGATQPLGRIDTTGHITDTASFTFGKHQIKFGGEYRYALLDIFYDQGARGTFTFDGSRGPWATAAGYNAQQRAIADFLAGFPRNAAGATIVRPGPGVNLPGSFLQRDYTQHSTDLFFHDTWQATPYLSLNFGARYTYLGPLGEKNNRISTFLPDRGIVSPGGDILSTLYPRDLNNLAPRFGFAWQPFRDNKTVLRGSYGIFFDVPAVAFFASNSGGNGGAAGVNANPGGNTPILSQQAPAGLVLQPGVDPFANATTPILGVLAVNQDFATPYLQNFNLNLQRDVFGKGVLQVGYVASLGRKLVHTRNINAALPGTGTVQSRRVFASQYPTLGAINQLETAGLSNYNSLQVSYNQNLWRGLTGSIAYTYSKAIDTSSEARNVVPMTSFDWRRDRGPAAFDTRQVFNSFVSYSLPNFTDKAKLLTQGWQFNMLVTAHTGLPFNVTSGTNLVGDPFAGVPARTVASNIPYFNRTAFANAPAGTLGNLGRNSLYGPGFATFDPSVFKNFAIREGISLQLRAEIFNLFNRANLTNPTSALNSGNFGLITNTRNGGGAPGLGFGEPRNVQFALKLLF
jgi:hypothetical protein